MTSRLLPASLFAKFSFTDHCIPMHARLAGLEFIRSKTTSSLRVEQTLRPNLSSNIRTQYPSIAEALRSRYWTKLMLSFPPLPPPPPPLLSSQPRLPGSPRSCFEGPVFCSITRTGAELSEHENFIFCHHRNRPGNSCSSTFPSSSIVPYFLAFSLSFS